MTSLETHNESLPIRAPHILVPLIKKDLEEAQEAGMPYYRAAGEKMIEAKAGMKLGQFTPWIKRHFKITDRQAREWMNLARTTRNIENGSALPFSSLRETVHKTRNNPNYGKPASWRQPVKEILDQARREQIQRQHEATMSRAQETQAEHKLALQLIDIGYKALATKLHPDKGGTQEAMARLNRVRNKLKQCAQ